MLRFQVRPELRKGQIGTILAIGVTKYPKAGPLYEDLHFAGLDAGAFANEIKQRLGPLHQKTADPIVLIDKSDGQSDGDPDRSHILNALEAVQVQTTINDTVAIFLSGHGDNDGAYYRFLPTEAEYANGRIRAATVLPWADIQEQVEVAKGLRLLFVDTCHSGQAYNELLSNQAYHADILAYTSSSRGQIALETNGHGIFTQAILEGLSGRAQSGANGVDTQTLFTYVKERVTALAKTMKKEQVPEFFKGRDAGTYPLAN